MNIVVVGNFNPSIFSPWWFVNQDITLSENEAEEADVQINSPQVTVFKIPSFATINVNQNRLQVDTTDTGQAERIRDLILGTVNMLPHTPLNALGINYNYHYLMDDPEALNSVGHTLAPKDIIWGDHLDDPKTLSLSIQGQREDHYKGFLKVKVEPSNRLEGPGLYMSLNDHYALNNEEQASSPEMVSSILQDQWGFARTKSMRILSDLVDIP